MQGVLVPYREWHSETQIRVLGVALSGESWDRPLHPWGSERSRRLGGYLHSLKPHVPSITGLAARLFPSDL